MAKRYNTTFTCNKCGKVFNSVKECKAHEPKCRKLVDGCKYVSIRLEEEDDISIHVGRCLEATEPDMLDKPMVDRGSEDDGYVTCRKWFMYIPGDADVNEALDRLTDFMKKDLADLASRLAANVDEWKARHK